MCLLTVKLYIGKTIVSTLIFPIHIYIFYDRQNRVENKGSRLYPTPDEHCLSNPNSQTLWCRCQACFFAHSLLPRTPDL